MTLVLLQVNCLGSSVYSCLRNVNMIFPFAQFRELLVWTASILLYAVS